MKTLAFAVPGDLATPTGGYAYDRRVIAELRALGWSVDVIDLGTEFPHPGKAARLAAATALARVPAGIPLLIDGLAFGALPQLAVGLRRTHPLVALVHHPLALETGLSIEQAAALQASERAALAKAHHVVATSPATARGLIADYGVPPHRLTVAPPGQDRVDVLQRQDPADGLVHLLAVGALVPRKGFDTLIAALAQLADLPWRLVIAGDRTRAAATTARVDADIIGFNLGDRILSCGAVSENALAAFYAQADIFVLASRFEGYGMAFSEALAYGLPVVGTTAGAIPETVPKGAGLLVPPDDAGALAAALRALITSPQRRAALACEARRHAERLPGWHETARICAQAIERAR